MEREEKGALDIAYFLSPEIHHDRASFIMLFSIALMCSWHPAR